EEMDAAVLGVVRSGNYVLGPTVRAFENEVAAYCCCTHAIGVASGTDALLLSLKALGIGPGDGVVLPSFTFFATAGVVANVGATPIFAEIDPQTFNLDPQSLREILTADHGRRTRVKAIIPVHLYGQMADMDEIIAVAREYDVAVIEDAAQAIGAKYRGSAVRVAPNERNELHELNEPNELHETGHCAMNAGSLGDFGCFSFFPTKNLGAYGDGGMITTNNDAYADKLRLLRVHGAKPKYFHQIVGTNSRLDSLQAAILRVKLPHLDAWTGARQQIAATYNEALADVDGIASPFRAPDRTHIYHQYTIRVANGRRDALKDQLKQQGIGTMIYYPRPLHLQECFAELGYRQGQFPVTEAACSEVLSLPVFPELTQGERQGVIDALAASR
ncbi:DegT/DnrJ/EryC1/StrS family aminotransferase, partial [Candidatus Bipolaricaulota bacterium]|nr:DegT/DnrJ/EryC1/StrS family aminotransferase [Candidatus Bipolaricaulota bacterium]